MILIATDWFYCNQSMYANRLCKISVTFLLSGRLVNVQFSLNTYCSFTGVRLKLELGVLSWSIAAIVKVCMKKKTNFMCPCVAFIVWWAWVI